VAHAAPEPDRGGAVWQPLIDPAIVFGEILRSRRLIVTCAIIGAVLGVAVALSTPRSYYASSEILIDPREWAVLDRDSNRGSMQADAALAFIENQIRVLTSRPVLEDTVERLGLARDPEFNGQGSAGFSPFALIGALRELVSLSGGGDGAGDRRQAMVVRNLARALHVDRAGRTFVVNVGVSTQDPEKSALIANTLTEAYLGASARILAGSTGRAADELTSRLDELRAGVEQAERAVETFKAENEIVDAQGRLITDDEITRLNDQLSQARARTVEFRARAESAQNLDVEAVVSGSLPEQIASGSMTELRAQYNNLALAAERLAIRLGPRHPERLAAEAQVGAAERQIQTELARIVSSLQVDLRRAMQQEEALETELARLKVRQGTLGNELVTLRELEREAAAKRAVYEAFLLRARETGEQRELNTANISIISDAAPPLEPSGLSRAVISAGGMAFGLFFGIGIAGARGAYRGFMRSPPQAATAQSPSGLDRSPYAQERGGQHKIVPVTAAHEIGRGVETAERRPVSGPDMDEDAELDDIRRGLHECRAAIEELARQRAERDRYGT
jgi:polysaccharide biosynthesis transport protein